MTAESRLRIETLAVHAGRTADPATGAVSPPIYLSTTFARAADLSDTFLDAIWSLKDIPAVFDIRGIGLLAGVEVHPEPGRPGARGQELQKRLFWEGLHVKWTGDSAIVAPSLNAEPRHIDEIVAVLRRVLTDV